MCQEVLGEYVTGLDKAHEFCDAYGFAFNRRMEATFNVRTEVDITDFKGRVVDGATFWLVKLNTTHYAWVHRPAKTGQPTTLWELVSKKRLPDGMKIGEIRIEVLERWSDPEIERWVSKNWKNAWHQSFSWTDRTSSDSDLVWNTIEPHFEWPDATVLDFGCNWGFHSCKASKAGASVIGVDVDLRAATDINDHIEMQDVRFVDKDPGGPFGAIIYTSVHHQLDPKYDRLKTCIDAYRARCKTLFVELIRPPMFGTEAAMDWIGREGEHLLTYKHRIRGVRSIYRFVQ